MLICDEVQSGMGRTGKWWAVEHTGVEPDMITIAKGIASGMPLSVLMTKAELMDWVPGSHASTFGGNPVCIAAALATMDVMEREGVENSRKVGAHMLKRMSTWTEKLPMVGDVRGRGLMIGVEIVTDKAKKTKVRRRKRARPRRRIGVRTRHPVPGSGTEHGAHFAAAHRERRAGRHRDGCARGVHQDRGERTVREDTSNGKLVRA